jgi:hypothetical protein
MSSESPARRPTVSEWSDNLLWSVLQARLGSLARHTGPVPCAPGAVRGRIAVAAGAVRPTREKKR